jgi:hypothetical protein
VEACVNRLKPTLDVLFRSVAAHTQEVRDAVEPLRAFYEGPDVGWTSSQYQEPDDDLAWFVSRVTFAVGPAPSSARRPLDLDEVKERVHDALGLAVVRQRTYYRIGDSTWTLYAPTFVMPGPEDAVAMLPKLPGRNIYRIAIVSGDMALFSGDAMVKWPEFDPPLLKQLLADDAASGFVRAELAVKGNAALPPAVAFKPST